MDSEIAKILKERKQFAEQMNVAPYAVVKKELDEATIKTAKEAAEGLAKLFEPLGRK